MSDTYETQAKGIRILPGQWRPHYPWEQIAWVSPPWPSQDYVWLDFPEAIFTDRGLIFLSHINPPIPMLYYDLPRVAWRAVEDGIAFERVLPDGVAFGGSVRRSSPASVALELYIRNGSAKPLGNITLQTCAYLQGIQEFAAHTMENKLVHVPAHGWIPFEQALTCPAAPDRTKLGWRSGPGIADLPAMIARSTVTGRHVAMTWREHTLSLTGNPGHPCLHADPFFPDLPPGRRHTIHGDLLFLESDALGAAEGLLRRG